MRFSDFKIGVEFLFDDRVFRCTDVGTRTALAIRIDSVELAVMDAESGQISSRVLSRAEAEAEGWFDGPPYALAEYVFDENDIGACERPASENPQRA